MSNLCVQGTSKLRPGTVDAEKLVMLPLNYELPVHTWDWPKNIYALKWTEVSIRRAHDLRIIAHLRPPAFAP